MNDVRVENHGTLFLFHILTDAARVWIDDNVDVPEWAWLGSALAVEHRYAPDLAIGMADAGLVVA